LVVPSSATEAGETARLITGVVGTPPFTTSNDVCVMPLELRKEVQSEEEEDL
jgi:hypothetical protein